MNNKVKPTVRYTGTAFIEGTPGRLTAHVDAIDHPELGTLPVRTSLIINHSITGEFETLNTMYVPVGFNQEKEKEIK